MIRDLGPDDVTPMRPDDPGCRRILHSDPFAEAGQKLPNLNQSVSLMQ